MSRMLDGGVYPLPQSTQMLEGGQPWVAGTETAETQENMQFPAPRLPSSSIENKAICENIIVDEGSCALEGCTLRVFQTTREDKTPHPLAGKYGSGVCADRDHDGGL